jgi:hypothetical protein
MRDAKFTINTPWESRKLRNNVQAQIFPILDYYQKHLYTNLAKVARESDETADIS